MGNLIMSTTYNHPRLLRISLIGIAMLFAVIGSKSSWAEGPNAQGNYDHGNWVWSKLDGNSYTYQEAVNLCAEKTKGSSTGERWELPTPEQMKSFYLNVVANQSKRPNWGWDITWLSTKVEAANKHDAVDLNNGHSDWNGRKDDQRIRATCVTSNLTHSVYDTKTKLSWSKLNIERPRTMAEAIAYCTNMENGTAQGSA